jgi:hypothetical protein
MKKSLALCTALLTLTVASSAFAAGLTLNWNQCIGAGAVGNVAFDCAGGGGPYKLAMELQTPALTGWFATDIDLDLQVQTPALGSFWHMEGPGCNSTGLAISPDRSGLAATTGCLNTYVGSGGASVSSLITAYGAGYGGANRARILVTVARSASSPINPTATQNYYMSHLSFFTDASVEGGGGTCVGCTEPAAVVWNSATLFTVAGAGSNSPEAGQIQVDNPGLSTNCMSINGGGAGVCSATPTLNKSWGAIKALYR